MRTELPPLSYQTLKTSSHRIAWMFTLALLAIASSGCQRGTYQATSLPPQLAAMPVTDLRGVDLTRLASASTSSQRIHSGDTLDMTVVTGAEDRQPDAWPVRVNDDGSVHVPLVGPIQLAGLDLQTAQNVVRKASMERGIYRDPSVSIGLQQRQTNRITVLGAVEEPGAFDLDTASSDLLAALSAAGGLTADASQIVEIRQPTTQGFAQQEPTPADPNNFANASKNRQVANIMTLAQPITEAARVDLVAATYSPRPAGYPLKDGAVVMVRPQPPRFVNVMGLVNRPDQFEMPPGKNVRVLDAIALAGGRTLSVADRVLIVRQSPVGGEPALIEVSMMKAKEDPNSNLVLADGDVVSVEETPTTFVLGIFQQFIRIGVNGTAKVF